MSTRLGGIMGSKCKTSSWYLRFPDGRVVTLGQQYIVQEVPGRNPPLLQQHIYYIVDGKRSELLKTE